MNSNRVVVLGAHVLDTLVRPVESIPEAQGAQLVDAIAISAAGAAGGTGLVLAKLGFEAVSVGAVGADTAGRTLRDLLARDGVDVTHLRETELPTSASVLPIRPDGSRPAFHVIGANVLAGEELPWETIAASGHLHVGAPEMIGPDEVLAILAEAHRLGLTTSVDCLVGGGPEYFPLIEPVLAETDYLLPNAEQAMGWTETTSLEEAARTLLACGAGCVAITDGGSPTLVATADELHRVPVVPADVVDTSGAGDAFSAGFIGGRLLGLDPLAATRLGAAAAAQVVGGLGTDFGSYDLASVRAVADAVYATSDH